VIAARTAQGYEDWKAASQADRFEVISRWHESYIEIRDGKLNKPNTENEEPAHGFLATRHLSFDERKKLAEERKEWKKLQKKKRDVGTGSPRPGDKSKTPQISLSQHHGGEDDEQAIADEFEDAIQRSITATSKGDAVQDGMIERAIRASVRELRAAQRIAKPNISSPVSRVQSITLINDDGGLERGVKKIHVSKSEDDLQKALEESQKPLVNVEDEDLKRALEESKREHEASQKQAPFSNNKAKSEEDIVMDYIKKQSLAEAEFRQNANTS
jgi:hypothetical protein